MSWAFFAGAAQTQGGSLEEIRLWETFTEGDH